MSDATGERRGLLAAGGRTRSATMAAGALIVVLALGALVWPGDEGREGRAVFLVFDSSRDAERIGQVFRPLTEFLEELVGRPLELEVVTSRATFLDRAGDGVELVFCPDGLALQLERGRYGTLVVGRRAAPRNLRPRGVIVYRKTAGGMTDPWISRPTVTVFGDSLGLTSTGAWRWSGRTAAPAPASSADCAWGPDPYDHAPALHAARLGGFDYAVVRQWDAEKFFAAGLLSPLEWGVEPVTVPVPDLVLLGGPESTTQERLEWGDRLAGIGRRAEGVSPAALAAGHALTRIGLVGFNLLVEPDFDLVRRNFARDWPDRRN